LGALLASGISEILPIKRVFLNFLRSYNKWYELAPESSGQAPASVWYDAGKRKDEQERE